jgi:hypothetical protein
MERSDIRDLRASVPGFRCPSSLRFDRQVNKPAIALATAGAQSGLRADDWGETP